MIDKIGPATGATVDGAGSSPNDALSDTPAGAGRTELYELHPLADVFPLMEGEAFDALVADINQYGLREPIWLYEKKILDGRNRYRACSKVGINPEVRYFSGTRAEAMAFVISANIHRRHLTFEEKQDLIATLIKADPAKSDRQIAKIAKVSPTSVGKERKKVEQKDDVSTVDTRKDTKGRRQPASKTRKTNVSKIGTSKAQPTPLAAAIANQQIENVLKHADFSAQDYPQISTPDVVATAVTTIAATLKSFPPDRWRVICDAAIASLQQQPAGALQ